MKREPAVRPIALIRHDPVGYGRALKQALWTRKALALVPGRAGWGADDGLLLADGLCWLFGGAARLVAVVDGHSATGVHFLVRVDAGRFHGAVYLDANGASIPPVLLYRWRFVEQVHGARLVPFAQVDAPGTRHGPSVVGRVGAFVRDHVTLPCSTVHMPDIVRAAAQVAERVA